ncbi:MAG: hypothetical protein ABI969_12995 [bacterium]
MAEGAPSPNHASQTAKAPVATDGAELRPLVMLLVLDGAVGLWSSLHAPWLQRFFITQIPLVGIVGLVWGLLGDDVKQGVTTRVTAWLRQPHVYKSLVGFAGVFFVITLVRSTVEVRALDPASSEVLFRVNGTPRDVPLARAPLDSAVCPPAPPPGSAPTVRPARTTMAAAPAADSALLNRLTTPVAFGVWTWPIGREVWFHTETHVSPRAIRVWPWLRSSLQYPEEFDQVSRVRALPMYPLFRGLPSGCAVALIVREHDSTGVVLAADTLSSVAGLLLTFRDSMPLDSLARKRWGDSIRVFSRRAAEMDSVRANAPPPDSIALAELDTNGASARVTLTGRWSGFRVVRTRRPLHVGEKIYWEVRGIHRVVLARGEVPLRYETEILLANP